MNFIAWMPRPPRPCRRYSSTAVRLANPPSVTVKTVPPGGRPPSTSSSSSPLKRMPVTPEVARPIGRSASSVAVKRTDIALRLTSSRSSSADTSRRRDQLVAAAVLVLAQVDGDQAAGAVRVVLGEPGLLDQAALGGEHQVGRDLVVLEVDDLGDLLVGLEGEQVGDVLAAGVAAGVGQLVGLRPVDPALVREEQDPVVGRRDEEVLDEVVLAQLRAAHALAAAALRAVEVGAGSASRSRHG